MRISDWSSDVCSSDLAADVTARVVLLEGRSIEPGNEALVRLQLDRPIGALARDRFILRDQSAQHTIGGGRIIDPFPPLRGARRPDRLAMLGALDEDDPVPDRKSTRLNSSH